MMTSLFLQAGGPTSLLACAMCTSSPGGNSVVAANAAIGFLLVILLGVLGSFLSFIFYLARRARRMDESAQSR